MLGSGRDCASFCAHYAVLVGIQRHQLFGGCQSKPESWNMNVLMPLRSSTRILALILLHPCSNFRGFAVETR